MKLKCKHWTIIVQDEVSGPAWTGVAEEEDETGSERKLSQINRAASY